MGDYDLLGARQSSGMRWIGGRQAGCSMGPVGVREAIEVGQALWTNIRLDMPP